MGWVGNAYRRVETRSSPPGILLRVDGGSDFYISPDGNEITRPGKENEPVDELDREILLGPAAVLSLAMRNTFSLHASAAAYNNKNIAFVGESGRGKSTLAAYLNLNDWKRIADDILPVTAEEKEIQAWPRFPQLKLPPEEQPGFNFPEHIPLNSVCLLDVVEVSKPVALKLLLPAQAFRVWISHTAGTRLFSPDLLKKHLDFCTTAAKLTSVYHLTYPHRESALPELKDLLETVC